MKSITVTAERKYEVTFSNEWSADLDTVLAGRKGVLIAPESLLERVGAAKASLPIISVPEGEAQKTLDIFESVQNQLALHRLDRSAVLIGLGGGATTDLTGFVAATYQRGISWIAVPTTVAGMVDAAVGGKTGLNLDAGKNLIGAFHSPDRVIVDFAWLNTLSQRDHNAGLAEAAKCGFIADPNILDLILESQEKNLEEIIFRAIQVKADVVGSDFKENYAREALNYGHTLGHAIEKHSDYDLRHGEAISIGMVFAAHLSARFSGLPERDIKRHREVLNLLELPTSYPVQNWEQLYELLTVDKKRRGSQIRFVTLPRIGATERIDAPAPEILADIYREAMVG